MRLDDLLNKVQWDDVKNRLIELYPDQEDCIVGYDRVYTRLKLLIDSNKILRKKPPNINICIKSHSGHINDEKLIYEVIGIDKDGGVYNLSHEPWIVWLMMSIDSETLDNFDLEEIVSHCLWEMTVLGFDQENRTSFLVNTKETRPV